MVALLDVNLLIALFDAGHVHHDLAHDWFHDQRPQGWATCATTEGGLVRVLTNRAYASPGWRAQDIIDRLRSFRQSGQHHFWPENVSLTDHRVFNSTFVHGHRQVTDIYLLGLAKASGGALATFDKSIPLGAVKGATSTTLLVVAPSRQ